jgi:sterol 3beta-glucosyltransferase
VYNLATHAVTGWGMWLLLGTALDRARRDVLGLPPIPFYGPVASILAPRRCLDG